MRVVLFLCTGNYYRSRFAEELFNSWAPARCPEWIADSRGIAVDRGTNNVGPVAAQTAQALLHRGVNFDASFARMPLQLKVSDLDSADHIVALKYTEHFPMMMDRFPSWISANDVARIEYWEVHDVDQISSELALPLIERQVSHLMARLHAEANV